MSAKLSVTFDQKTGRYVLAAERASLGAINNALNEVCNGVAIEEPEFQTRLGCTRAEMQALLDIISTSLR
jgi:hypothetical protein